MNIFKETMRRLEKSDRKTITIFILGCLLLAGIIYMVIALCGGISSERWIRLP